MSDYLKYYQRNILTPLGVVFPCNHVYNFDAFIFMAQFSLKVGKTFIYTSMCSNMCCMCSIMSTLCDPVNWPTRPLCLWNFLGKNTGVDCHFLHQRIFPTQMIQPSSLAPPALAGRFFSIAPPGKPHAIKYWVSFMKGVSLKQLKCISFLLMHSWWLSSHRALKYIKSWINASTSE